MAGKKEEAAKPNAKAKAKDKTVLKQFYKDANEGTYRKKVENSDTDITYVPSKGFGSKTLQKKYFLISKAQLISLMSQIRSFLKIFFLMTEGLVMKLETLSR